MISSLSIPMSGRKSGSVATLPTTARFSSVCEATCPTASPVIKACALRDRAIRSATRRQMFVNLPSGGGQRIQPRIDARHVDADALGEEAEGLSSPQRMCRHANAGHRAACP